MTTDASFYALTERYPDEKSAIKYFEKKRWPDGVTCPLCKSDKVLRGRQKKRNRQLWYCHGCDTQFSVTSGTIMEDTKLPLRKWLLAFHLMGASKKGVSSLQLARMLEVTYKTAWHLAHRIRVTMPDNEGKFTGIVETDETYMGGKRKGRGRGYRGNKIAVQTIIKRNSANGRTDGRAHTVALNNGQKVDGRTVGAKLRSHTKPKKTILMTDDSSIYDAVGKGFKEHHSVNHKREEYVRLDPDGHLVTTNTAEGYFANLKRQIVGTHHHTSQKHLPKYLKEHDFKYNTREGTDTERTEAAIKNIEGKRLRLFKPVHGKGQSLFSRREGEPRPDVAPGVERKLRASSSKAEPTEPKRRAVRAHRVTPPRGCTGNLATCECPDCAERRFDRSKPRRE